MNKLQGNRHPAPSTWLVAAMMALRDVFQTFADSSSMHGIPKVINAKSTFARVFWSVVCITAGGMFCVQFAELLQKYFSYPKKVTVEVVPSPMPFPAISVCNMRNLDIVVLNTLNRKFINNSAPYYHIQTSKNPFIKEYMKTVAKYAPLWYEYQEERPKVFQEVFSRTTFSANIETSVISEAAVQLDEFLVTCQHGGHTCNRTTEFLKFYDPYYFNCYTYTAPRSEYPEALSEGIENGWSAIVLSGSGMLDKNDEIRMLPGLHEWRSPVSSSEGVRVVIHPPTTKPFPFTEGYDVPPGFSASFGIRPRKNIRIGYPHGNCSDTNPYGSFDQRYRLMTCQKMCLQNYVVEECGCADVTLPTTQLQNFTLCRSSHEFPDSCMFNATKECFDILTRLYDRIQCARITKAKMAKNATAMEKCTCFPPCHEIAYDVSYSLSKWPAGGYENDAAFFDIFGIENYTSRFLNQPEKHKMFIDYFGVRKHDYSQRFNAMQDFARLNVYIADSNVVKTEESEDYGRNQMVSDIGGQLGLWVGISLITLAEVLELLCELFRYFTSAYRSVPRHDTFSNSTSLNHNNFNNINHNHSHTHSHHMHGLDYRATKL